SGHPAAPEVPPADARVPAEVVERLGLEGVERAGLADLGDAGARALQDALAGEGDRGGAYRLLAADDLVTRACDVALEEEYPETALLAVLSGVLSGGSQE